MIGPRRRKSGGGEGKEHKEAVAYLDEQVDEPAFAGPCARVRQWVSFARDPATVSVSPIKETKLG